jgi:VCBS repeat protein
MRDVMHVDPSSLELVRTGVLVFAVAAGMALVGTAQSIPSRFPAPVIEGSEYAEPELADLDRDGLLDLVSGDRIQLGTPEGGFSTPIPLPNHSGHYYVVALADFNCDSDLDLAAMGDPGVDLLLGDGTGHFRLPVTLLPQVWGGSILAADFDLDGNTDLAVGDYSSYGLWILLGDGLGGFGSPSLLADGNVCGIGTGFFDADALPDLAVASGSSVLVHMGTGGGRFGDPQMIPFSASTVALAVADIDGDLHDDVISSGYGLRVHYGVGNGTFNSSSVLQPAPTGPLRVTDLNRDGRSDIVCTLPYPWAWNTLAVLLAFEVSGFEPPELYFVNTFPWGITVGDVDHDGEIDVLCSEHQAGITIIRGAGDGRLVAPGTIWLGAHPAQGVAAADFNGDGHADFVATNSGHLCHLLLGDGQGRFSGSLPLPIGSTSLLSVDLDADGDVDVLGSNWYWDIGSRIELALADGVGGFRSGGVLAFPEFIGPLQVLDLDEDGGIDLACSRRFYGIQFLRGDGTGAFTPAGSIASSETESLLAVGDVNGDRHQDLVTVESPDYFDAWVNVRTWMGPGNYSPPVVYSLSLLPSMSGGFPVELWDADSDHDLDLVVGGLGIILLRNRGDGTFSAQEELLKDVPVSSMVIENINAAPGLDLVAGLEHGRFVVLSSLDAGAMAPEFYSCFGGSVGMACADFDGGGWQDIVSAVGGENVMHDPGFVSVSLNQSHFLPPPTAYCTAKPNSIGCIPQITSSGEPSVSASSGFSVRAENVISHTDGVLLYSIAGQAAVPFHGGMMCLRNPVQRTIGVPSGGNPPPRDCSGIYALDFNAFAGGALGGAPIAAIQQAGTVVDCQWWGRDPGFGWPDNVSLSNALEFGMRP